MALVQSGAVGLAQSICHPILIRLHICTILSSMQCWLGGTAVRRIKAGIQCALWKWKDSREMKS